MVHLCGLDEVLIGPAEFHSQLFLPTSLEGVNRLLTGDLIGQNGHVELLLRTVRFQSLAFAFGWKKNIGLFYLRVITLSDNLKSCIAGIIRESLALPSPKPRPTLSVCYR